MDTRNLSTLAAEAGNENTSPQRLEELARSSPELAQRVAQNPSAPPELLRELSRIRDRIVRRNITANPNTPTDILQELAVRYPDAFLENPMISLLYLEQPDFIKTLPTHTAFRLFQRETVPTSWLEQASVEARKTLARARQTRVALLDRLANDRDASVRREVAGNPRTPDAILQKLANDEESDVRKNVAENPQTCLPLLQKLACDRSYTVREAVARHPYTPISVLQQLAEDDKNYVRSTAIYYLKQRGYDIYKVL
jgi:Leucine rich repeat variant